MNWNEIRGLKYFIGYVAIIVGSYTYSHLVGLMWWNKTSITQEKNEGHDASHHGPHYFYHK